jgi:hypothetical protein
MGQYYKAVSLDTKQFVSPFGAKLMEHSWLNSSSLLQVEQLLSPGNPWHKTKIVWTGDYADKELFTGDPERNLYDLAADEFLNLTEAPTTDGPRPLYIVNHTKNIYIKMSEVPDIRGKDNKGWKIHPLSILTSSGNGRGGGDYRDDDDTNVGSWAGDVISSEYEAPVGMEKFTAFFIED